MSTSLTNTPQEVRGGGPLNAARNQKRLTVNYTFSCPFMRIVGNRITCFNSKALQVVFMVRICEVSPHKTHSVRPIKSITEKKGVHVQRYLGRTVLICEECGQRLVLTDPDCLWHLEPLTLECGCGEELTLAERIVEGGSGAGAA